MLFLQIGSCQSVEAKSPSISDELLCIRAQVGDLDSASCLTERYYRIIYAYLRRRSPNKAVAQDLTQQTFMHCWRSIHQFGSGKCFASWLHRIGHNVLLDWQRKESRWTRSPEEWWEELECAAATPGVSAEERDLARFTYEAVQGLATPLGDIIHLHFYQGLSLKDVAEVLGISAPLARYRMNKALKQLRDQLDEKFAMDGSNPERHEC